MNEYTLIMIFMVLWWIRHRLKYSGCELIDIDQLLTFC